MLYLHHTPSRDWRWEFYPRFGNQLITQRYSIQIREKVTSAARGWPRGTCLKNENLLLSAYLGGLQQNAIFSGAEYYTPFLSKLFGVEALWEGKMSKDVNNTLLCRMLHSFQVTYILWSFMATLSPVENNAVCFTTDQAETCVYCKSVRGYVEEN